MWSTKVVLDDAALLEEALLDGADLLDEALLTRAALLEDRLREPSAIAVLGASRSTNDHFVVKPHGVPRLR